MMSPEGVINDKLSPPGPGRATFQVAQHVLTSSGWMILSSTVSLIVTDSKAEGSFREIVETCRRSGSR